MSKFWASLSCGYAHASVAGRGGLWARVDHLYCAQKPQNQSSGEAKTQKPTKSNVALKRRKF
jgi:hypothetical protein